MPESIIIATNLKNRICIPIVMEKIKGAKSFTGAISEEDSQISIRQALGEGTEQARIKNILFLSNLKDSKTPAFIKELNMGGKRISKNEPCNLSIFNSTNLASSNADIVLDGQVENDILIAQCSLQDDVTLGYKPYTIYLVICLEATQKV